MEKDGNPQGVNTLKDRQEGRVGQFFTSNVRAEINATAAKFFHCPIDFTDSGLRILHGERR